MEYTYNLSGALVEQKYPSGRIVKNILDSNGDLSIVQSKKNANYGFFNYAKHFTYTAAGAVQSMQLGNGRWESATFNSRLQPTQIALGVTQNATNLLDLDFSYGTTANNGNVLSQTITVPTVGSYAGFTATQTYNYDSLNRIKDAAETISSTQTWKQTFSYDRYGNRSFDEGSSGGNYLTTTLTRGCSTSGYNPNGICDKKKVNPIFDSTNRIAQNQDGTNDYTFDNGGNTTKDASGNTFIYDGENRQIEVKNSSSQTIGKYWYDGDGKRIKKYVPATGETTIFVYDASGKMVAEYSTIVASQQDAQVSYLTNDHLGSPRIITDETGAVTSRRDFMPFGEEVFTVQRTTNLNYSADNVRQKFTGYERDGETDLDFAQTRYYARSYGRFTSPDNFLNDTETSDPMSWNLYVYVRNNPLKYVDPTGEQILINFEDEDGNKQTVQYLNGKLYTGTFRRGRFVRGAEYKGNNSYATKVLDYLNTLKGDSVLASRLSTLEKSSRTHTIMNTNNLSETGSDPTSRTNADNNIPTGSIIYFNADKAVEATVTSENKEPVKPIITLAHELLGHSWDYDQGKDNRIDANEGTSYKEPIPGTTSRKCCIEYSEMSAVQIENRARKLIGEPNRTFYMGIKIPENPPKTTPPIFINKP